MKKTFFKLVITFLLVSQQAQAQNDQVSAISVRSLRTELNEVAFGVALDYMRSYDSLMNEPMKSWPKSLFTYSPEIRTQLGTEDAFSSITAKASGFFITFDTTNIAGWVTPDSRKVFHVFPVSAGIETQQGFSSVVVLAEAGYMPWYQKNQVNLWPVLKHTSVSVFVQAGYKFFLEDLPQAAKGGNADQSAEDTDNAVFRAKGTFKIDTKRLLTHRTTGLGIGLIGNADGWYDFAHLEVYYRLQATLRIYLSRNRYFDFQYEKGSGAPNFNQGEQFGAGLTISF